MQFLLIDRVIQKEGFYVYNMYNIEEKLFSIGIALERSRGRSLVINKATMLYMSPVGVELKFVQNIFRILS
jgi:hypothetical protein